MPSSSTTHNLPSPLTPLPSPPHAGLEARLHTPSSLSGSGKAPVTLDSDHLDSSSDDNMQEDESDTKEDAIVLVSEGPSRAPGGGRSTGSRALRTREPAAPSEGGKQRGSRGGTAGRSAGGKVYSGGGGTGEMGFAQQDKILDKEYAGRLNFDPFAEQLDLEMGTPAPTTAS